MARKPKTVDDAAIDAEVNAEPKVKHPIPDGFLKPSDFALYVSHHQLWPGTAAQIFSFTKGAFEQDKLDKDGKATGEKTTPNGFPAVIHTDGRKIIDRDNAIGWLRDYSVRRAEAKRIAAERTEQRNRSVILSVGRYTLTATKLVASRRAASELAAVAD